MWSCSAPAGQSGWTCLQVTPDGLVTTGWGRMQVCRPAGNAMEAPLAALVVTRPMHLEHKAHHHYNAKPCIWVLTW